MVNNIDYKLEFRDKDDDWFPIEKGSCPVCGSLLLATFISTTMKGEPEYEEKFKEHGFLRCPECGFDSRGHQTYEMTFGHSWINPDGSRRQQYYFGPKPKHEFKLSYVKIIESIEGSRPEIRKRSVEDKVDYVITEYAFLKIVCEKMQKEIDDIKKAIGIE